jgi:negative regulator of sigma E activity
MTSAPRRERSTGHATGNPAALARALAGSGAGLFLAAAVMPPCAVWAQQQQRPPVGREIAAQPASVDARALLRRMLQAEMTRAYSGREATFIAGGPQSEQWVKRDPRRGLRREWIRPPGDLLVDNFRRSWFLSLRDKRMVERESLLGQMRRNAREEMSRSGRHKFRAEWMGRDVVAGRTADIVRVVPAFRRDPDGDGTAAPPHSRPKAPHRRFYIDQETGIRLKTEEVGPDGRVLSSSYFLSIDLSPAFTDADFARPTPPPDVRVEREQRDNFPSIDAAQPRVGFPIRRPGHLPEGFALRFVTVIGPPEGAGKVVVVQRYANGLNSLSLFQTNADLRDRARKPWGHGRPPGEMASARGPRVLTWSDQKITFTLIGNLSPEEMQRIADSVR